MNTRADQIEQARRLIATGISEELKEVLEKQYPELKESEDERIRKEIIQFLRLPHPQFVGKRNHEEWVAYLEKQKEQKPSTPEDIAAAYQMGLAEGRRKQKPAEWSEEEDAIKTIAAKLLDLARKEIMDGWSKGLRDTQDFSGKAYNDGYQLGLEKGKAEALKDLPRWKKATGKERFNERMIVLAGDNDLLCTNYAEEGEYYISFPVLEKLPKED